MFSCLLSNIFFKFRTALFKALVSFMFLSLRRFLIEIINANIRSLFFEHSSSNTRRLASERSVFKISLATLSLVSTSSSIRDWFIRSSLFFSSLEPFSSFGFSIFSSSSVCGGSSSLIPELSNLLIKLSINSFEDKYCLVLPMVSSLSLSCSRSTA